MGVAVRGLLEYKRRNADGRPRPTVSDEATFHIVFIPHELTKLGVRLLKNSLIPPPPKCAKLTFMEAAEACLSASGSFPLLGVRISTPNY